MTEQAKPLVLKLQGIEREFDKLLELLPLSDLTNDLRARISNARNHTELAIDAAKGVYRVAEVFSNMSSALADGELPDPTVEASVTERPVEVHLAQSDRHKLYDFMESREIGETFTAVEVAVQAVIPIHIVQKYLFNDPDRPGWLDSSPGITETAKVWRER